MATKKTTAKRTTTKKQTKSEYGIKEKDTPKPKPKKMKPIPTPNRIRMLMTLGNQDMTYITGHSYKVGKDVSPETAKSWLNSGAAEEDRSEEPPETK